MLILKSSAVVVVVVVVVISFLRCTRDSSNICQDHMVLVLFVLQPQIDDDHPKDKNSQHPRRRSGSRNNVGSRRRTITIIIFLICIDSSTPKHQWKYQVISHTQGIPRNVHLARFLPISLYVYTLVGSTDEMNHQENDGNYCWCCFCFHFYFCRVGAVLLYIIVIIIIIIIMTRRYDSSGQQSDQVKVYKVSFRDPIP